MTIRNNGNRRDPKLVLSAVFLLAVAIVCLIITIHNGWKWSWILISAAMFYLSFAMFRNSNEG